MAPQRHLTWRIQNIPSHYSEADVLACFHSDDKKYVHIRSLAPDVSNYDGKGTLTATLLFSAPEKREPRVEEGGPGEDLILDKEFIGFTPLNSPSSDVCADIIAVTGLAGHAFGSWSHSAQKMWLRDYLPKDIGGRARILIYGYKSRLDAEHEGKGIISDFADRFIHSLMDIRDHPLCRDRPLIMIGHSLGALVIKHAITDLDPNIRARLPLRTVLFFGAPHNGLETTALETLVKGRPTQALISELKRDSPTLIHLAKQFRFASADLSIHTYYETRPTKTVALDSDGSWQRKGEPAMMVDRSSALLNLREETQIMVDGDHKEIARLRPGQGGVYLNVLRVIKDALQSASEQFAAARAAEKRAVSTNASFGPPPADMPTPPPSTEIEEKQLVLQSTEPEYDHNNLLCDVCCDEFPKTQTHFHCYICDDGFFNICMSCKEEGAGCPKEHDLVERALKDDDEDEEDEEENYPTCDGCGADILEDDVHFRCDRCRDEYYFIVCFPCRKTGLVCPGRHKLTKFPLSTDRNANDNNRLGTPGSSGTPWKSPSPQPPRTQTDTPTKNASALKDSTTIESPEYCDIDGCDCSLPKRPKVKAKAQSQKSTPAKKSEPEIEYCDVEGCECDRPRRPNATMSTPSKTRSTPQPTTGKTEIEYCDIEGCECDRPRRPTAASSNPEPKKPTFPQRAASKRVKVKYCDLDECNCDRPKRPKPAASQIPTPPESTTTTLAEEEPVVYCDIEDCNCGRPRRPKPEASRSMSLPIRPAAGQYCDIPGCNCGLPSRLNSESTSTPKARSTPKAEAQEYCDIEGCSCSLPRRPKSEPAEADTTEYCDIDGCNCSLPRRPGAMAGGSGIWRQSSEDERPWYDEYGAEESGLKKLKRKLFGRK